MPSEAEINAYIAGVGTGKTKSNAKNATTKGTSAAKSSKPSNSSSTSKSTATNESSVTSGASEKIITLNKNVLLIEGMDNF